MALTGIGNRLAARLVEVRFLSGLFRWGDSNRNEILYLELKYGGR